MSLDVCLPDLIASGKLDAGRAREAQALYENLERIYRRQFGDQAAKAMASAETLRQLEIAAAQKKRIALLQRQAQVRIQADMASFAGGQAGGPLDPRAAIALLDRDSRARYSNVEARRKAIKGRAHGMMDQVLARHRRNLLGTVRDRTTLDRVVRELFGENTGDAIARELADAWTQGAEYLRGRYNAAGGHIGQLERWGLPQAHDSRAVKAAGYHAWRDFVQPRLDRARMIDTRTGAPFTDEALELVLRDVYETIATDGWSGIKPGVAAGKMLANQRAEHRFLHFDGADAWLGYQERFGSGTAFDAMMGHVEAMSRDIAAMEILGPNPDATVRWLKDSLERSAAIAAGDNADRAHAGANQVQRLWDEFTGLLRRPESRKIALGFGAVRSVQTAAKLGSAVLSATTDLAFGAMTRRFNGIPARGILAQYAKLFLPGTIEDRRQAVRAGLIAEEWSSMTSAQNRYLNEEFTGEWARRLASGVLRVSGLARFTQAGRWAFGMEFLGFLTDNVGRRFAELPPALRASLERHGIASDGWDRIRATPLEADRGTEWLYPKNVADRELGDRLLELIHSETDFAVPMADLRTRALINSVAPKGTILGEVGRSMLLFKTFGITVMLTQGRRIMEQSAGNAARYAAGLFITTTIMGAVALQLKELAKGRDPRAMDGGGDAGKAAAFWGAAMLQGGGWGIFGDFLSSSTNRFGGGLASTAAGPTVQTADNLLSLTVGNAARAVQGDKTNVGRDVVQLLKQETPGGSIWYSRLAFERLVLDQLQAEIDPDHRQAWRRMERRAAETGQEFYWEPGEAAPDRAPDLSAIVGGQ